MTGEMKRKMQIKNHAKTLEQRYGMLNMLTSTLMGLVLAALVLAAMIAPS